MFIETRDQGISAERIRDEICKIIVGNHAPHLIELICRLDVHG